MALIARHERHPPEFRAEKLGERQMARLDKLGLGTAARAGTTRFQGVWLHRFGRIVDRTKVPEYGSDYSHLVDALRRVLRPRVTPIIGRTETIESGPDMQRIVLADGRQIEARLLIVATGMANGPREQLGIGRDVYAPGHTLAAGFHLKRPPNAFPFPSLVWTGERFGDRVSYLTLFPLGDRTRANLYVYREQSEAWTRAFRDDPVASLRQMMPDLEHMFGPIEIDGPVVTRPIDLMRTRDYLRAGVVLIGDAFCTVCPVTGTGIDKALNDVDLLCNGHIPRWLATSGMGRDKIADFYADPVKIERDASAVRESMNARARSRSRRRWGGSCGV